jgi:hypothetical protein
VVSLLDLAINGYSADAVKNKLNMKSGGREIGFRFALLNKNNAFMGWVDQASGSIAQDSRSEIKRTGNFQITRSISQDIDLANERMQPYFRLQMPDGGWAEWSLGVFLLSSPTREFGLNGKIMRTIDAYDKAQILAEDKFTSRHTIAAGTTSCRGRPAPQFGTDTGGRPPTTEAEFSICKSPLRSPWPTCSAIATSSTTWSFAT